jgi:hypothetical protein
MATVMVFEASSPAQAYPALEPTARTLLWVFALLFQLQLALIPAKVKHLRGEAKKRSRHN